MAEITQSLFGITPESYQQAQNQALQAEALKFAQLDPMQQAQMSAYMAGSRIGTGIGGLLGAEDPELERIRQSQQLLQGVDLNDPASLRAAAQQAMNSKNYTAASQLAQKALDVEAKLAATKKDIAAAARERQQAIPADIQKANTIAAIKQAIRQLETQEQTPEVAAAIQTYTDQLNVLTEDKSKKSDLAVLLAERAQLDPVKNKEQYDLYNAKIKKLVSGKGLAGDIAEGLAPMVAAIAGAQAKEAGKAGGAVVGKDVAAIQGKYTALGSVNDALDVVERGIYAGGYGPLGEAVAKYSSGAVGSKQRLVNTEEFRAYIGDVVIPRLQEFGGNDSVEELKYLRSVMAGETTLEEKSIKRILQNAGKKIRSGIQRLEAQQKAIQKGEPLPTSQLGAKQYTTKSGVTYTKED